MFTFLEKGGNDPAGEKPNSCKLVICAPPGPLKEARQEAGLSACLCFILFSLFPPVCLFNLFFSLFAYQLLGLSLRWIVITDKWPMSEPINVSAGTGLLGWVLLQAVE